ncbi:MAG: exodeoxyribonuclease VII small subunit [Cyanobacteria bacterium P01_H01_bin.162]
MTKAAKAPRTASPKTSSPETDPTWSYEATVAKIEATVTRLEQGELPLAAVFEEFEQAVVDLQQCESFLQARQEQVDLLIETLGDS